jgi:hypothetical protein
MKYGPILFNIGPKKDNFKSFLGSVDYMVAMNKTNHRTILSLCQLDVNQGQQLDQYKSLSCSLTRGREK